MRARLPDADGFVERDGVRVFYEVFGDGDPTILLMPAWSITHSRTWKMQVPFLARHYRVITFDGRGNGRSDRPPGADRYLSAEYAADALAVMDATGTDRAAVVSLSCGASYALHLGAASPQRVVGQVFICPATPLAPFSPLRLPYAKRFEETLDSEDGWAKDNARYWERDYQGFLEFFFSQVFTEPHSTKPMEDGVAWGLETTSGTLIDTRRDQAIADELRKLHPDLEIDWLAQHPVTAFLAAKGERIHPASKELASESGHIEGECADHDLHCFQAWRRMDEILLANFMVFHDIVEQCPYDLWIGDEAWELDYYLHENPEQKRAAYAWLTDFVGWLPMPDGGSHEAALTADYNAEMIEHIARYPRVRDRAIFVGAPDDIVPDLFGPGLPAIRAWTEAHHDFSGDYITGFGPSELADREAIRAELGYAADDKVCIVTVGGSSVGAQLLRRVIDSYPEARRAVPGLRMVVVAGPRIDPRLLPAHDGVQTHAYVHDLYRHLAVCDLAVVQGGLATTMELVASSRPFLYFPLGHHFEQTFHVLHRLARYGAGRRMDYATATPEVIGSAIAAEIGKHMAYRPIDPEAVSRVADRIAEMM